MNRTEMRNEFVVLYNNIMSNQAPGLNDYEISVFLTKGQDEILKDYANPKGNKYQEGIDDSLKRQIDFSNLINTIALEKQDSLINYVKRDPRSQVFKVAISSYDTIMFITNEYAMTEFGSTDMQHYISVQPISYTEYQRLMAKPYKWPVFGQAWRLINSVNRGNASSGNEYFELVCKETIPSNSYFVEFIRKPYPIIVSDLGQNSGVSIDGYYLPMDCELDSILHNEIVQRAVELAKAAYVGDLNATIQMGQRSE